MDFSTISNKTACTEVEEVTNGELSERYYLLKKQFENLSLSYESTKQELHDVRRSYQTALDVQGHLTVELESHQSEELKRRNELNNRITNLQEDLSAIREERSELIEKHAVELSRLQNEIRRLKDEAASNVDRSTPEKDNGDIDEIKAVAAEAVSEANSAKAALNEARAETASWRMQAEALTEDMEQMREAAEVRKDDVRAANERENVALAELAEVKAMLHQFTNSESLEPHAAKGNSLFAEVEDKRQEMAKTLIQMKQTNSKLRRDLANKQAELETLLHEKQTIWEQQLGAAAHYDRELVESYEERISQLEALTERQRRELARWFGKLGDAAAGGWLAGVLQHLKTECEKLRAEVLSRGAAQLASAAQVRELRRKLATITSGDKTKQSPEYAPNNAKLSPEYTPMSNVRQSPDLFESRERNIIVPRPEDMIAKVPKSSDDKKVRSVEDVRKKVTFN